MDWSKLRDPFAAHDVEWMIQGKPTKKGSTISARCLAYVTNRAIQERLDDVASPGCWRNEYREGPLGGVLCGLSILVDGVWITKWDGAENTDIEPIKGGLSNSMKRAGAQWGIGRYLYYLPEGWAIVRQGGRFRENRKVRIKGNRANKEEEQYATFYWDPPELPEWALPGGSGRPPAEHINKATGEIANTQMPCPVCHSPLHDLRSEKARGKVIGGGNMPDLKCSNPKCSDPNTEKPWAVWLDTWANDLLAELEAAHGAGLIDAKQRTDAEEIVADRVVEVMVKLQIRLNAMAEGGDGEAE